MENADKKRAAYRRRCEESPFEVYCVVKRSWCKKRGVQFDLTPEYLEGIWTGTCPVFGTPLNVPLKEARGRGSNSTAHLDRFDPDKGYVEGNVCWISGRANRIKYDATLCELKQLVSWMERVTTSRKA